MTRSPLPRALAWRAVARCFVTSMVMLAKREIDWPRENVGRTIRFANGTTGRVYRETSVAREPSDPCFLGVSFRLSMVRGRAHTLFRLESILNTPLFVGFPGFVSKLWLAHDGLGTYRGLYEWDGADQAEHYARSLCGCWSWSVGPARSTTAYSGVCVVTTCSPTRACSRGSQRKRMHHGG